MRYCALCGARDKAHARRKFHELWASHGRQLGEQALRFFIQLYEIEREVKDLAADECKAIRQDRTKPVADALHQWMTPQRQKVPDGSATARAIDYSLKRWKALVHFIDDGELPFDNNWVENQIQPITLGRNNWLFAGSLRAGKRAAVVMSLMHATRLNGHYPCATCSSGCLRSRPARLPSCCRIAGRRRAQAKGAARRQYGFAGRLPAIAARIPSHQAENANEEVMHTSPKSLSPERILVGPEGFEPSTNGLRVRCSTN